MKNQTNLIKRIRNIIVGNTLPANEDLWLDTSDGEKKSVLKYKGNPIVGGSGGSTNPGYSSTKQTVTLFNDTIETVQSGGMYQGDIENIDFDLVAGETYTVVFDGTSYNIKAVSGPNNLIILGEFNDKNPSFETYPFFIDINTATKELELITTTEGSHTVEIKHEEETVTTTPEFKSAVDSVTGYSIDTKETVLFDDTVVVSESTELIPGFPLVKDNEYKVTFNGTEYICKCFQFNDALAIGASPGVDVMTFDWSDYPFVIAYDSLDVATDFIAQTPGTYTLKVETLMTSTKTTPAFESMIQGIAGGETVYYENLTDDEWDILRAANPGTTFNDAKKVTTANADTNRIVVWDERHEGGGSISNLIVASVIYMSGSPMFLKLQNVYNSNTFDLQVPYQNTVSGINTEGLSNDYFYYFETETNG